MSADKNTPRIEVTMLGGFSIAINGYRSISPEGRTKRVWILIQYLLANRRKDISIDTLTEILWEEDECSNPLNALKNLVYRARQLLKEIAHGESYEFIQYAGDTYQWNNNYDCTIDTEKLVENWKLANDSDRPEEERIQACKNAVELYRGEFLPKSSYKSWVMSMSARFETIYHECLLKGCSLLAAKGQFEMVSRMCQTALLHVPYDESIHKMLMYAYINTGQFHKALDHYNKTVALFSKELDVDVSVTLRPIYKQIMNSINRNEVNLDVIKRDLNESALYKGAYFCDYDVFKSIYQIRTRMLNRNKFSIFVALLTLTDPGGGTPKPEVAKIAIRKLKETIFSCLRVEDVFSAYSATQFILMLLFNQFGNAETITKRIAQKFHLLYGLNNVRLAIQTDALDAIK